MTEGAISLFGQDVTRAPTHRRAALGLARTFQITNLFPDLTVLENCLLAVQALSPVKFSMLRPVTAYGALRERARAMLEAVGLEAVAEARVQRCSPTASSASSRSRWPWPAARACCSSTSPPRASRRRSRG